jgi:hypothetical protein
MTFRRTRSVPNTPTLAAILAIALSGALVAAGCAGDGDQQQAVAAETSTSVTLSAPSTRPSSAASSTTRVGSSTTTHARAQATTGRTATPTTKHATTPTTRRTATTRRTTTTKAPVLYRLTVIITGGRPDATVVVSGGGTCPPKCQYSFSKNKSVTLTPNPQNHHQSWSAPGLDCNGGPGSDCTVQMTQNWTVTADFDTNSDESAG